MGCGCGEIGANITFQPFLNIVVRENAPLSSTHPILQVARLLGIIGLFGSLAWIETPLPVLPILLTVFFVAFLSHFPFVIFQFPYPLSHLIAFTTSLVYGPMAGIWGGALGVFLTAGYHRWQARKSTSLPNLFDRGHIAVLKAILLILPIGIVYLTLPWDTAEMMSTMNPLQSFVPVVQRVIAMQVIHTGIYLLTVRYQERYDAAVFTRREWLSLLLIFTLPVIFITIAVQGAPILGIFSLIAMSGAPAILSVLLTEIARTRLALERSIDDLSSLNKISLTLQSSLNMDSLLNVIQEQTTSLLKVDNFYVALVRPEDQTLWYPIALKNGKRETWVPRSLTDRMTDRVIVDGKPILLAENASAQMEEGGAPAGQDELSAWVGVPLITPNATIGCLAVFSMDPNTIFTEQDLHLLTTLSGQMSVALQNTLLYEQAQHRAAQLEELSALSTTITGSLDLQDVLRQVCQAVIQVGSGQKSAIYILDPNEGEVWLAHAEGLSDDFITANTTFNVADSIRGKSLRTGEPILAPNTTQAELDADNQDLLTAENIRAFAEFPLATPDGEIGILSVYFEQPTLFDQMQLDLLNTFASQAALAVANARLHAHTDIALTRRAHQLSILESIGRQLSAITTSERLFQTILDYALEFTGAPWGSVELYERQEKQLRLMATKGYKNYDDTYPDTEGIVARVIRSKKPLLIGNTNDYPEFIPITLRKSRSQLAVPMLHEDRVQGIITLESPAREAFTENDQAFIQQLANQASIVVVNAELYKETQRRLREQASLYLVSTHLVGNMGVESVAQTISQAISAALEATFTGVYLWDAAEDHYALSGLAQSTYLAHTPLPETIKGGKLRLEAPTLQYTKSIQLVQSEENVREHLNVSAQEQVAIVPLTIANEHYGIVVAYLPKTRQITDEDRQLPYAIAAQGSIALQNALLFNDVTRANDRMEAVLDSVTNGVMMINLQGEITLANATIENLLDIDASSLVQRTLADLSQTALQTLGFQKNQLEEMLVAISQGQVPMLNKNTVRAEHLTPERHLECLTAPVWGRGQNAIGLIIVVRDVTEEIELQKARELITQTLVHDLKSPIGAIKSALMIIDETVKLEPEPDDVISQSVSIAQRSANRVMGLVESLLEIARMESGELGLAMNPTDLKALVTQTVADYRQQAASIDVLLQARIAEDIPMLLLDQEKITRVLTNLLDNALKFSPSGTKVKVHLTRPETTKVLVEVIDKGPGIPDDFKRRIFDQFSQVPGTRGRKRGSGLGLTFCRLTIEGHGGKIWVDDNPAGGSIFKYTLPINPAYLTE